MLLASDGAIGHFSAGQAKTPLFRCIMRPNDEGTAGGSQWNPAQPSGPRNGASGREVPGNSPIPLHYCVLSGSLIFASVHPVSQAYDDAATPARRLPYLSPEKASIVPLTRAVIRV